MLSRQQKSQLKFLSAALTAFLLAGAFVGGAIYMVTNRSGSTECGLFVAGDAADIGERLDDGGPYFVTGGGNCSFWLALDDGDVVAVRPRIEDRDCSVRWRASLDAWVCDGQEVEFDDLARYPTSLGTGDVDGALLVDFRDPASTSTTRSP